jgi:hypothetical protein
MPQKRLSETRTRRSAVNRVSLKIGVITTMAALSALVLSTAGAGTAAAQSYGKDGMIHACYKAKGKNKGALRIVPTARGCRKLRGWRPVSWGANGAGVPGQAGQQGASGSGSQGSPGPEGKEGPQGSAGQVEKTLLDTIKTQSTQIDVLTGQVTDLTGEVLDLEGDVTDLTGGLTGLEGDVTDLAGGLGDLEGTVDETCSQLTVVTDQADEIVTGVTGVTLNNALQIIGGLVSFPGLPATLGTFECD